ncbi:imidazole glycerol phosphate synthase subunit HisH, partial [Paenibacillus sp. 28ISP30-2]|nr:imidazole glycerol phosphate synthase subunit HisH [Paenibacillus sp. 28ISP30-2]
VYGMEFPPKKSGKMGMRLLPQFLELAGAEKRA